MHELRVGWNSVRALLAGELLKDPEGLLAETEYLASATTIAVLDTLRLESRQSVEPELREIELEPWLRRAVAGCQGWSSRHKIVLAPPAGPKSVRLDEERATAVLVALLNNAIKFTGGGTLSVRATVEGERLRIVVEDEGPGIPDTERARVFDKGFRGAGTAHLYGYGMGLYVAQRVAREVLGGSLTLEDSSKGARFRFEMPVAP